MSPPSDSSLEFRRRLTQALHDFSLRRAVFSKPRDKSAGAASRIDVRPIVAGGETVYQIAQRTGNQEQHENLSAAQAENRLMGLIGDSFLDVMLEADAEKLTLRHSRKGKARLQREAVAAIPAAPTEHNRTRAYLIPEGEPVPFLVATGIMSEDGRVKPSRFKKFRQINRYLEFLRDALDRIAPREELTLVDFGCGKSYLTFAAQHFLSTHTDRPVNLVGLDLREDVVATSRRIADECGLSNIQFHVSSIADFQPSGPVDVAFSLHACDTATDDAILQALRWKAEAILAAPCCQHELAAKLDRSVQPSISRHGILHERFAAMATDTIRAALLETVGYATQVMEFIETEHTPKNLLIRALRRPAGDEKQRATAVAQLEEFKRSFGLPTLQLERGLNEPAD